MTAFADTFYWIALINPKDSAHAAALGFSRRHRTIRIITSDEVLTEFLDFCAFNTQLRMKGTATVEHLFVAPNMRISAQSRASFLSGLDLYRSRPDKRYSLTDCISMQTMRREGLDNVLTNDQHFQQEGFRALFRDL